MSVHEDYQYIVEIANLERRGSVVVSTSALHESSEFKTRTGHGYVWYKNLALNFGDCISHDLDDHVTVTLM